MLSLGGGKGFRGKAEKVDTKPSARPTNTLSVNELCLPQGKENPYSCVVLAGWRSVEERRQNLQVFSQFLLAGDICIGLTVR